MLYKPTHSFYAKGFLVDKFTFAVSKRSERVRNSCQTVRNKKAR